MFRMNWDLEEEETDKMLGYEGEIRESVIPSSRK